MRRALNEHPVRVTVIVLTLAALAALAAIAVVASHRPLRDPLARLAAFSGTISGRPVQARLNGFTYAPFPGVSRGNSPLDADTLRLRGLAGDVISESDQTARGLHARGTAELVTGQYDAAIATLRTATQRDRNDAATWSDLAASHYERGRQRDTPEDFVEALAATNNALEIDNSRPEAMLNHALALEALHLQTSAQKAWKDYIHVESDERWISEARDHLTRLDEPSEQDQWKVAQTSLTNACMSGQSAVATAIVARFPQQTRRFGENSYLPKWGAALLASDPSAVQRLQMARCIGQSLLTTSGESLLANVVAEIDAAAPNVRLVLARAFVAYDNAGQTYRARKLGEASTSFEESRILFQRGLCSMQLSADYYLGCVAFDANEDALPRLNDLLTHLPAKYRALRATVQWERSLALTRSGHSYEALETAQQATRDFDALGETNSAAHMRANLASLLAIVGRRSEGWKLRRDAFGGASRTSDPLLLEAGLASAAGDELAAGNWQLAAALYREQAELPTVSPRLRADALLWTALAHFRAGNREQAERGLRVADSTVMSIGDPGLRMSASDDFRFVSALLAREATPATAVRLLSETIAFRKSNSLLDHLAPAYLERARACRAIGADQQAVSDLDQAISLYETQRLSISQEDLRDSFLGTAADAFDEALDLSVSRNDYPRTFALAERYRVRVILDHLTQSTTKGTTAESGSPGLVSIGETVGHVPAGTVLLELTTLPERSVVLVIDSYGLHAVVLPAGRSQIAALRTALTLAIANDREADFRQSSTALFQTILMPLTHELDHQQTIVIVPDETTASIPFATLMNPSTGRMLIEDHPLVISPGATIYTHLQNRKSSEHLTRPALVVGDPAIDTEKFDLPRLPEAREEAIRIAELYPGTRPLIGNEATRERFLEAVDRTDIVHFAGHAVVNEADPSLSVIPFAKAPGSAGVLYLHEIAAMHLSQAPIVFLAACHSSDAASGAGSIRSFGLAFLAAGSRAVVGTLWNVDDAATRDLSLAFHRELRAGAAPAIALRNAQLTMLHSPIAAHHRPRTWGAFQVQG